MDLRKLQAWLVRLAAEQRKSETGRVARHEEWTLDVDLAPTSAEAKVAVAMLLGELRVRWAQQERARRRSIGL